MHSYLSNWPCIIACAFRDVFAAIVLVLSQFFRSVRLSSVPWLCNACFKLSTEHGTLLSTLERHLHGNPSFPLSAASSWCLVRLPKSHTSCGCMVLHYSTMLCCALLCHAVFENGICLHNAQHYTACHLPPCQDCTVYHRVELTNLTLAVHSTALDFEATANTVYTVCSSMPKPLKKNSGRPSKYLAQLWAAPSCGRPTVPTSTLRKLCQPQEQGGP